MHLGKEHHLVQNLKQVLQTATKEVKKRTSDFKKYQNI